MHPMSISIFSRTCSLKSRLFMRTKTVLWQGCHTSPTESESHTEGPLHGIRVLDMTRILAGPFTTMILSDLGAEVIKVEKLGSGDDTRQWGPPFINDESCYFMSVNRNKKSIAVDYRKEEGRQVLYDLAKKSDVLIENFVPGTLERHGLGYENLKSFTPQLIYCSISGYGSTGPYKNKPGYDVIAASIAGLVGVTGPEGGDPCKVGVAMTDLATGLYAHGAIMAALIERQKTGKGQMIACNLLSTQVACMVNLASNYLNANIEARRLGTAHESIVPYQSFPTKDGYITLGAGNNQQFSALCKYLGMQELLQDERYTTNANRVKNRKLLLAKIEEVMKQKSTKEWVKDLEGAPFPNGPIQSLSEVFTDPQVLYSNLVKTFEHPTAGTVKMVGPPVQFSSSSNYVRSAPPILGQHTQAVLHDVLGYSQSYIDQLIHDNVVEADVTHS
ncbi:succinyl-CoA:glutarate CoA-transferase [Oratosquilla oratoria]|uniref:succinyl-CoA:glutarate CoA-transferase n=1 Tax=Oratosquilla oratoria TaxID=337810 RepID=UPI003F757D89